MRNISVLIKPASGSCNMNCRYCFYKDEMENRKEKCRGMMTKETAVSLIKSALEFASGSCTFMFQGGEPTLIGTEFYTDFINEVNKLNKNKIKIYYALQTNGYCIDEKWCDLFKKNSFLIGLSLDGGSDIHNENRVDNNDNGTFNKVMKAAELLKKHNIPFNILSVLTGKNAKSIVKTYNFFKKNDLKYLQFIPCLEPQNAVRGEAKYSLSPKKYENCLITLFRLWLNDLKSGNYISIRHIDNLMSMILTGKTEICSMNGKCSVQFVTESDGSIYPCDFYAIDEWKIGNAGDKFSDILKCEKAVEFCETSKILPEECTKCSIFPLCKNGCRRDRTASSGGDGQINYYCSSYKGFFQNCKNDINEAAYIIRSAGQRNA